MRFRVKSTEVQWQLVLSGEKHLSQDAAKVPFGACGCLTCIFHRNPPSICDMQQLVQQLRFFEGNVPPR